jgi:hypothetical protein
LSLKIKYKPLLNGTAAGGLLLYLRLGLREVLSSRPRPTGVPHLCPSGYIYIYLRFLCLYIYISQAPVSGGVCGCPVRGLIMLIVLHSRIIVRGLISFRTILGLCYLPFTCSFHIFYYILSLYVYLRNKRYLSRRTCSYRYCIRQVALYWSAARIHCPPSLYSVSFVLLLFRSLPPGPVKADVPSM